MMGLDISTLEGKEGETRATARVTLGVTSRWLSDGGHKLNYRSPFSSIDIHSIPLGEKKEEENEEEKEINSNKMR